MSLKRNVLGTRSVPAIAAVITLSWSGLPTNAAQSEETSVPLPDFAYSSFKGMDLDINGIRLDLPIRDSLRGFDPNFRFKVGKWTDSQGQSQRQQTGLQNVAGGSIWDIRESISVSPVQWHSGEYIYRLTRELIIKPEEKKPAIDGFIAAVNSKYGPPTHIADKGSRIGFIPTYAEDYLVYTIKNGKVAKSECWDAQLSPFNARTPDDEKLAYYKKMLAQIKNGYCEAIIVHFYTPDPRNRDRIRRYGSRIRDFRLEANAFIEDYKQRRLATQIRQENTPEGETKL